MIRRFSHRRDAGMTSANAGMTLPELMVSVIIFGILGSAVVATMTSTLGFFRSTTARASDLNGAQVAVDAIAKALQSSSRPPVASGSAPDAIISAGPTDLSFYAYDTAGKGPSRLRFFIDTAGELIEQRTPATNCIAPITYGATTQRVLATGVRSGDPSLFSYSAAPTVPYPTGSPLPLMGTPQQLRTSSPDDAGQVEIVTITLSVRGAIASRASATAVTTTVDLINHLVQTKSGVDLLGNAC